jgi:acetoin utilization deacetylase AcuC-like enzyme
VLLICAGYDALAADELAGLGLTPEDFATSIDVIVKEFGYPAEKLALGLEGGYCLDQQVGMPAGLRSTVGALVEG